MADEADFSRLVTSVFRAWEEHSVPFLILRNYEALPRSTTNDIDVLVEPRALRQAERALIDAAREQGFRLHNRARFATLALYLSRKATGLQVHFDLFSTLRWRGFDFLPASELLRNKAGHGLFSVPHPAHEAAASLLGSVLYTGRVKPKYRASISSGFRAEPALALDLLAGTYGKRLAATMVKAGAQGTWAEIESLAGALRRALVRRQTLRRPLKTATTLASEAVRLAGRWLQPPGLTLVLLGADGSGKSTAARAMIDGLSGTFSPEKGAHFHWKPPLFSARRQAARRPTTEPHRQPARNPAASVLFFLVHWVEFFLGCHLRLRPITFRGGLVVIDRYYYDFFVDQRRYRLRVPNLFVRIGYSLLTKPDLVILLDAPESVLRSRKQEVNSAETRRQCAAYRALVDSLPNGVVVDAAQSAEKVVTDIRTTVLDLMADRVARRQGH